MKNFFTIAICTIIVLLGSCSSDEEKESIMNLSISAKTIIHPAWPFDEQELMVATNKADNTTTYLTLREIKGFEYKKGIEYELIVKKTLLENPPQDGSNCIYSLVKILSEKKIQEID